MYNPPRSIIVGTIGLISLFQWQFLSPSNSPLYIHSILVEDLICHWHLSWVCILAIGDTTAVNAGVSVSFWMTIFRNIGPGVGVRILGLAVLKFFLLACGGCPFKGLLPMSSHYLLALSSIYCLQTLRMPMLSDGIWLLVVILIGIIPVIISDAEHLVLWPSGFFLSFVKGCEENWPLKLGFWKSVVFGIHFCNTFPRTFSEGSCH